MRFITCNTFCNDHPPIKICRLQREFNFIKIDRPSHRVFGQRRHHALFNMQPACDSPKKVTHNNSRLQLSWTGPSYSLHKNQFLVYFCTASPRNCMSFFVNYTFTYNCLIARQTNALKSTADEFCKLLSFCLDAGCWVLGCDVVLPGCLMHVSPWAF